MKLNLIINEAECNYMFIPVLKMRKYRNNVTMHSEVPDHIILQLFKLFSG